MYVCKYVYVLYLMCLCVYIYVYVRMCMCVYMYIFKCTDIHMATCERVPCLHACALKDR